MFFCGPSFPWSCKFSAPTSCYTSFAVFRVNVKNVKGVHSWFTENPASQLRDVTYNMGSHSVTCYPTQVNAPGLNPASKPLLDLPTPEGWKAELT